MVALTDEQKDWIHAQRAMWIREGVETSSKRISVIWALQLNCDSQVIGRYWSKLKKEANGEVAQKRKEQWQLDKLEEHFAGQKYPDRVEYQELASASNLTEKQVRAWFENQRIKRGITEENDSESICMPPSDVIEEREQKRVRRE